MKLQFTTAETLQRQFPHMFDTVTEAQVWLTNNEARIAKQVRDALQIRGIEAHLYWDGTEETMYAVKFESLEVQ